LNRRGELRETKAERKMKPQYTLMLGGERPKKIHREMIIKIEGRDLLIH
jgi:hypothetical protein